MRIAYLSTDRGVPVFGTKGSSIHVQSVVRGFRRLGHEVQLFTANVGGEPPEDLADVAVHPLTPFGDRARDHISSRLAEANAELIATVMGAGQIDLVYERYALWSYGGMEAARGLGVPGILEVNAPLVEEARQYRGAQGLDEAPEVARRAFQAATAVVAVSAPVARYVRDVAGQARVAVIPNGVDPARFDGQRLTRPDRFTIGFVGTMKPWHGLEVLCDAFAQVAAQVPAARLLMVGDGPERARIADRLAQAGLADLVEWTGAVPADTIPALLARMDVGVAPYPEQECYFSPLKVFEYLAGGVVVVASRTGQLADVLTDRRNALLVPPGRCAELAEALTQLAGDAGLRARLASAGRQLVEHEFTWDRVVARILRLITLEPAGRRSFSGVTY